MSGQALEELVGISRRLGSDCRLVWKGGGNISIKSDDGMVIKASGSELGRMTRIKGWRQVRQADVIALLSSLLKSGPTMQKISSGLAACCCDNLQSTAMPSIETFFHALLGRCVVHLHPIAILPYLCSKEGRSRLSAILKNKVNFHWIPFRGLGVVTAGQIQILISQGNIDNRNPVVLALSNHGLIISCDTAPQARAIIRTILGLCQRHLNSVGVVKLPSPAQRAKTARLIQTVLNQNDKTSGDVLSVDGKLYPLPGRSLPDKTWFKGTITPEELTYLRAGIVWVDSASADGIAKAVSRHKAKTGQIPIAFWVDGSGLYVAADKKEQSLLQQVFAFYVQIRGWASGMGGLKPLSPKSMTPEGLL